MINSDVQQHKGIRNTLQLLERTVFYSHKANPVMPAQSFACFPRLHNYHKQWDTVLFHHDLKMYHRSFQNIELPFWNRWESQLCSSWNSCWYRAKHRFQTTGFSSSLELAHFCLCWRQCWRAQWGTFHSGAAEGEEISPGSLHFIKQKALYETKMY